MLVISVRIFRLVSRYGCARIKEMKKDWSKLYKRYKGMWVALADDETTVLGAGKTVKEAVIKAKAKTSKTPFLTLVPNNLDAYIGAL